MTGATASIPPFAVLAAALRSATEHLGRELARPSESPPAWTELEWTIARAVAVMQGTAVLLAHTLRWRGPPSWESFLVEQREQALVRHARTGELLERLDAATRDARIACVALKGSALRGFGIYRPGERPMADIDLLVDASDAAALGDVLRRLDYVEAYATRSEAVYRPRPDAEGAALGMHPDDPIKIEIHTAIAKPLPFRMADITARVCPDERRPGLNSYSSASALLVHLLLHAAGNMLTRTLRQIQLHDIAMLAARLAGSEPAAVPADAAKLWWAYPPLALAARYYPEHVPAEWLRGFRESCPRVLRFKADRWTLTDVSWSNLRIYAFPGLAWSRGPLEAVRYMQSRVLPERRALAELRLSVATQPQLRCVPWYHVSHAERIARWLFSRPPRVQTIASVAAALEQGASREAA